MENTSNYGLKRWDPEDRILHTEFNDNWDKIDTALKGNADKAAALQTALASCGNCQIGISTYTGTGTRGEEYPTVITFPKMPTVFFVRGRGTFFAAQGGASEGSLSMTAAVRRSRMHCCPGQAISFPLYPAITQSTN